MKRRNTLTAVLFLAFLAMGFWLLASAFIQGGALREQFGLVRRDLSQLPAIFALSLFLGYVAAATKNVVNSILLHFVNNVSSFLLLWSQQQMDGTNAVGLSAILFTLYFGAGLLALAALIRRGGAKKLPRYPTRKNRMGRTERILSAPVFVFMLLILILIAILEYFR